MKKIILDLCGGTGAWSKPYSENGYKVFVIDPNSECENVIGITIQQYLFQLNQIKFLKHQVHGILAAPPCTEFASSGARWWKQKDPNLLKEAIIIVRAVLAVIDITQPEFWCLENPVGRLQKCVPELGPWRLKFNPCDYGDPYTKQTCLWGKFNTPKKNPVEPILGSKIHTLPETRERPKLRSLTPKGFAEAFFNANQ